MTLSFVEAMRGWLRPADGPELPVSFELRAVQRRPGRGLFDVRGVIASPPLARETPARGTLEIGVRALTYHLEFVATDGRLLTLDAVKHPTLRAPVRSMTRMRAVVGDTRGATIASGEMRFAVRDLPGFVASWLTPSSLAHRELDTRRRGIERRALSVGSLAR
jgi:hypothetical protein